MEDTQKILNEILEQLKILNSRPIMPPYQITLPNQTQPPQCTCNVAQSATCPLHGLKRGENYPVYMAS